MTEEGAEQLAARLAAEVGKESGPELLRLSRAALTASASRSGSTTSEFKLSALLVAAGMFMIAGGLVRDLPDLRKDGVNLMSIVGAGYAASRGLAKMGAGLGSKGEAPR